MEPHERLKAVREKQYETAADAARQMGVEPGTYRAHEEGRGTIKHLPRYAQFFKVSIDFLMTGRQNPSPGTSEAKHSPIVDVASEGLAVKGYVHASAWQDHYEPDGDLKTLPITGIAGYPRERQYALEVTGESINRRASPGHYAICLEWHGQVANDDVVVVERRRPGQFQATIKVVRMGNGEVQLWPDSNHPDHQKPIIVTKKDLADGEEIAVVAKVIGFYKNA
jgi:transcriptional regulator with XRE-family HTH domain